ncbi:MAG: Divalent-cation tolerance protein CutA [Candidatus Omnitrophica bacterium ADurb.Bin277]|nr:MAG: Divalent-cation tolerance protein CutA [Candidatus Omnitrophica bacterium ADurb.Bin277]
MKHCCIVSAVSNLKEARKIAGLLLFKKLAACVQLVPGMESHYRWKGKKETAGEILVLIKTRMSLYKKVESAILKHHPYEVPEIICLPVSKGSKVYLDWMSSETSAK